MNLKRKIKVFSKKLLTKYEKKIKYWRGIKNSMIKKSSPKIYITKGIFNMILLIDVPIFG